MDNNSLSTIQDMGKSLSNWQKPGGTLAKIGVVVGAGGGLMLLYSILPFLITLASNVFTLALLAIALVALFAIVTNKKFLNLVSMIYFSVMRKLTGLVIETDPIAIIEHKLGEMRDKIKDISTNISKVNGLNLENERRIAAKKSELEEMLGRTRYYTEKGMSKDAAVYERQAVRLEGSISRMIDRLETSKSWYKVLMDLKTDAELTVKDTEYEVRERKEEFESIRAQHKAFSSIMSIIKGDPNEMENFQRAMDYMAHDVTQRLGEMSMCIEETGGVLANIAADRDISSKKALELLDRYDKGGLEGLFGRPARELQPATKSTSSTSKSYLNVINK